MMACRYKSDRPLSESEHGVYRTDLFRVSTEEKAAGGRDTAQVASQLPRRERGAQLR